MGRTTISSPSPSSRSTPRTPTGRPARWSPPAPRTTTASPATPMSEGCRIRPTRPSSPSPTAATPALRWSVGWGDQYDQTDSGQPIDLTGVADGTYVLEATVDPQHVLTESNTSNN